MRPDVITKRCASGSGWRIRKIGWRISGFGAGQGDQLGFLLTIEDARHSRPSPKAATEANRKFLSNGLKRAISRLREAYTHPRDGIT